MDFKRDNSKCFVVMSFFHYRLRNRFWGMMQMNFMKSRLENIKHLSFFKLLGTGGGFGFSIKPDFATYALLTVWDDKVAAKNFESSSEIMNDFRYRTKEIYSIFMIPVQSRGSWSGANPFHPSEIKIGHKPLVVITRASIRVKRLLKFWLHVSSVTKSQKKAEGLLFTKGIGELPLIEQATISIWKSLNDMQKFAYHKSGAHAKVVEMAHEFKVFSEDLFARFLILETKGSWRGADPVSEYL
ncbi:hypothetical protein [Alkalitalea saponilacus]|uniref:Spheroidene monooxygenase n=1 Tax=Alkalitalea saponilacus TaxID=889453 RepID=A0A1T5HTE1_9BACT|nr:hypothetical protein [Alkalitalea saponilacus]ASB50184.1 spheroidene monooxygenase [Alkalitalea saponilacus]SKC23967.1 hypothetical protein SAMN03080601_03254 [Alkalitalea saponilacus]